MGQPLKCSYSTIDSDELITKVISQYRILDPLECRFWERGANDTYQVRCVDAVYFLRVYRSGAFPFDAIEFEAEALSYLHQQGFPVAYPIARKAGGYITKVNALEGSRYVLLSALAEGISPDYNSLEHCRLVGESVAQLHLASNGFETSRQRPHLDLQSLLDNSMVFIRRHIAHRPDVLDVVEKIAEDVRDAVESVPKDSLDFGICHGDLHGGNLYLHDGKVTHFDFEECAFGYRVYDLATLKWGTCSDERRAKRWPAIVDGYNSVRPLSDAELSLIDRFVILRELSELAYGIRHIKDFGQNDILASDIDEVRERLDYFARLKG